ncbi:hypothetical protein LZ24_00858 [Desulfobotulus alkaliphilus]|uniref:Uncharacterized protein n=1 Tax=Desulfobotulus alkaliphilus TaxID=622671 RepID=A0A562S485_9BACT|nr:hypothetical protein [Desulfobotulus alkaliphilus]TWI75406.1 hypothetical protein LZ24_00858 [Desulfobotulus alkaliphilus]
MKKKTPFDDIRTEYELDYSKARKNRFASEQQTVSIILDPDIASVFKASESVNKALRALLEAVPHTKHCAEDPKKDHLHP